MVTTAMELPGSAKISDHASRSDDNSAHHSSANDACPGNSIAVVTIDESTRPAM